MTTSSDRITLPSFTSEEPGYSSQEMTKPSGFARCYRRFPRELSTLNSKGVCPHPKALYLRYLAHTETDCRPNDSSNTTNLGIRRKGPSQPGDPVDETEDIPDVDNSPGYFHDYNQQQVNTM